MSHHYAGIEQISIIESATNTLQLKIIERYPVHSTMQHYCEQPGIIRTSHIIIIIPAVIL